jgi:hypothetical protein
MIRIRRRRPLTRWLHVWLWAQTEQGLWAPAFSLLAAVRQRRVHEWQCANAIPR